MRQIYKQFSKKTFFNISFWFNFSYLNFRKIFVRQKSFAVRCFMGSSKKINYMSFIATNNLDNEKISNRQRFVD